jgi:cytochrome c oxidase cbb3-type subunit 4
MDTYSLLREIADSYVLALLFAVFAGAVLWAFRPGSRPIHDDAANAVFRHDAPAQDAPRAPGCANACQDCTCAVRDALGGRADG